MLEAEALSQRLLPWYQRCGRKDLPWQLEPAPYRVWVSEIMLQQTQVATVIPYYQRFMSRFLRVEDLAAAGLDEVMHHWSGLGYYARARNLHKSAQIIVSQYKGRLPDTLAGLQSLPGIGRSTAGAILSLAQGQIHAILDGNVKRVLARCFVVEGWPGQARVQQQLWSLAQRHTPTQQTAAYNQAMMDLGATLCRRSGPDCPACPLSDLCLANEYGKQRQYPAPRPRKVKPVRTVRMVVIRDAGGEILLEQRPPQGLWGGLWGLPECPVGANVVGWVAQSVGLRVEVTADLRAFRHTLSHFHLDIEPIETTVLSGTLGVMERSCLWYNPSIPEQLGLAAPVVQILSRIFQNKGHADE